jgi:hypothetical protein
MKMFSTLTLALLMLSAPNFASAQTQQGNAPAEAQQCMTDDGYGRTRPCEALYHPHQEESHARCETDEGNGRTRPCESLQKRDENSH